MLKIAIFLGLILIGMIIFAISKETIRKRQVEQEIGKLKEEASKIEKENVELSDKVAYLNSNDYKEKEAKDKLNLQSPGENVVIVKPGVVSQGQNVQEDTVGGKKVIVKVSNLQKWWDYFFKY